jgi:hypothetical protein
LLQERFKDHAFQSIEVSEDETYDGAPVIRIAANVGDKVAAEEIYDALESLHSKLRARGDHRFVFLSTKIPSTDDVLGPESTE